MTIPFMLQNNGGGAPIFDLPLVNMNTGTFTIAPRYAAGSATPTYTGATAKTTIDFEGLLKTCLSGEVRCLGGRRVRNVVVGSSEDFTNVNWVNSGLTVTPSVSDPWGGTTAQTLTSTANNKEIYQNIPTVAGNKHAAATWIRRRTGTGTIRMYCNNALVVLPLTSTWQRLGASATAVGALVYVGINIAVSGDAVDIVRIQHENTTGQSNQNPSEYVSVGVLSAPVYHGVGVDGVKVFTTLNGNTVASNVVSEATGAPITSAEAACAGGVTAGVVDAVGPVGYLPEGARTQRALHSQAFSNAVWVSGGGGIAVTDNSFVAPDGTTTADTMTASGANGTLIQDLGTVGSAAKAGGLWLYRKTGTGNIDLTLDGGSTWTTKAITAAWTRVQISQTLADEDFGIRIVASGDEVYAWQGQVETASFLSSDIASTTVAVTRNADVLTYVSAGNISGTVGSAYAEYFPPASRIKTRSNPSSRPAVVEVINPPRLVP